MSDEPKQSAFKKRGGVWSAIGFVLVVGIIAVAVMKWMDQDESAPAAEPYTPPKHLIIISIDTLRADHLGCYGHNKKTSPVMDALASEGVLFENHFSNYPLTLPAHLTQMTGVSALGHRVRDNLYHRLPDELATLPEVMKAQGFRTGAFVSAHTMKSGSGIERGFETYDDAGVREVQPGRLTVSERDARDTLSLAENWIAGRGSDRFFCFIHLFDPHAPYEKHEGLGDAFSGDNPSLYDGEIAYTDQQIGRFLRKLQELNLYDDSLIVITSDHGEGLGDHNELTHGYFCYDSTTHVPLIMRGAPGIKAGTRVKGIARNYDLAPTLVEIMGLDAPEFSKQWHGLSLMPAMKDGTEMGLTAYVESHYAWLNANWARIRGLRTQNALTLFAGDEVLHFADARQQVNSFHENAAAVGEARVEITRLMNAWVPPRKGGLEPRETGVGTPYPGESPVAQSFEPESLSDTRDLPSPHARADALRDYQTAELDYDAERFASCGDKLRELVAREPDFLMAHKLLAAVDQARVRTAGTGMDQALARTLTREAVYSLERAAAISEGQHQAKAVGAIQRNLALLYLWLNDKLALRKLSEATDDAGIGWMFFLVSYRVATLEAQPEAAAQAGAFLDSVPADQPFVTEARNDLARMIAGEELKLAPWER
ncbi:MAG: sulfatase [Planctomycetes bacterium]|nr:sulfatase [Planctomycetota bacterium]